MTFIASVIAQEGVAIVADSFVTTVERLLDEDDFIDHVSKKSKIGTSITYKELMPQFKTRPSYTRNYMDKLFPFGNWSAITTSGQAYINRKVVRDLVREIEGAMAVDTPAYDAKSIDTIIQEFCDLLKGQVIAHLADRNIAQTSFIFSYFNQVSNKAQVFSIKVAEKVKGTYAATADLVIHNELTHLKIVTDGQDDFVDRLIFGSLYKEIYKVKRGFLEYLFKKIKMQKARKMSIAAEVNHSDFLQKLIVNDIFAVKFRELSLQEAVDFASLLVKIVMDIQIYTEKIPTVGGLIRLATISKEHKGFQWVSGNKIETPKIIL